MNQKYKPLIFPGLFTLICCVILLKLGFWQLDRLQQKEQLLKTLQTQMDAEPTPLETALIAPNPAGHKVTVTGKVLPHKPILSLIPRTYQGENGKHLYAAFQVKAGQVFMLNLGWVPEKMDIENALKPFIGKPLEFAALLKIPEGQKAFTPPNELSQNRLYWVDLPNIGDYLQLATLMPLTLEQVDLKLESLDLKSPLHLTPPNNHLSYAFTWFSLSLTLLVIYIIYIRQILKRI